MNTIHIPGRPLGHWYTIIIAVLCLIGAIRIVSTYTHLSQTIDETAHIGAGMEWVGNGRYTYELLHPPLARASTAVFPYLAGVRYNNVDSAAVDGSDLVGMVGQGNFVLHADGQYKRNLSLARLGILPYFIVCVVVVAFWSRRLYGDMASICAVVFFTTIPPVLAHAGLATTDFPNTTGILLMSFAFFLWMRTPDWRHSIGLGLATGVAFTIKFSAIFFFPLIAIGLIVQFLMQKRIAIKQLPYRRIAAQVGIALAAAFVVIWAVYRFTVGPILSGDHLNDFTHAVEGRFGAGSSAANALVGVVRTPVPMPAFWDGIMMALWKNTKGHAIYLLGNKLHNRGDIRFFPVVLAVKTPLPLIVFILAGAVFSLAVAWRRRQWSLVIPLWAACSILVVCLPSNINLGVRHILPIYPFLAMIAGYGAWRLFSDNKRIAAVAVGALVLWHIISTSLIHPDYIAYFNEVAGSHPEEILVDSDLDWGQDLFRLEHTMREKGIDSVSIAYFGNADLARFHLPAYQELKPYDAPRHSWVAASVLCVKGLEGYEWLQHYTPVEKVGHSIWLYRIDPASVHISRPQ